MLWIWIGSCNITYNCSEFGCERTESREEKAVKLRARRQRQQRAEIYVGKKRAKGYRQQRGEAAKYGGERAEKN